MKEDFLHYIWKFQKFDRQDFTTTGGESLRVHKPGAHNLLAGPDFFNAQLEIDSQLWAGNVEIHINSSHWYSHGHEMDPAYDNVILHVVWEHDAQIFRKDCSAIPTLVIKDYINKSALENYNLLFTKGKKWINCENEFGAIDAFTLDNWLERLYIERLQKKEEIFLRELSATKNHWEELLFRMLCKNFGLNINGTSFFSLAKSIEFSTFQKCSHNLQSLEALLLGQAGILERNLEDGYFSLLQTEYKFLKKKFSLNKEGVQPPQFFRLRPPNFPTLRLAQFASLYHQNKQLFSEAMAITKLTDFYELFRVAPSEYWNDHYNFGVVSAKSTKYLTKNFIDLLVINTLLPLKFSYARQKGENIVEDIIDIASHIPSEKNAVVQKFHTLRKFSNNSFYSQALLELKQQYCERHRCLQCAVGTSILGVGSFGVSKI